MLTLHHLIRLVTLTVLLLGLTDQARADFVVFGSRDVFRAAIAGVPSTTEGWDEFASGTIIPNGALVNGVVYVLSDPTINFLITAGGADISSPNGLGRTNNPFGGEGFVPSDIITLAFPTRISAFGVSFNTASTAQNAYTLTTNLGNIASSAYDPFPGLNTGQFAGFVSGEPIFSVTIRTLVFAQFGFDDMISARTVLEPNSLTLLAIGLLGSRLVARRERQRERQGVKVLRSQTKA